MVIQGRAVDFYNISCFYHYYLQEVIKIRKSPTIYKIPTDNLILIENGEQQGN